MAPPGWGGEEQVWGWVDSGTIISWGLEWFLGVHFIELIKFHSYGLFTFRYLCYIS